MPTTTDITDWTGVQADDVVVYDGGLVLVEKISVIPEEDHPDFLIAHVSGRALSDDGTPDGISHMSLNARSLTAARRDVANIKDDGQPASCYHETVTDLRRTLVRSAEGWNTTSSRYFDLMHTAEGRVMATSPAEVRDAYAGSLMAYGYSYALAAVLGVAEREFGPRVAKRLAFDADEILTNGDFDNLNADVTPADDKPAAIVDTGDRPDL